MSVTTIFDFLTAADYSYDAAKVEFIGEKAQLKLIPTSDEFTQDFISSTGFVFDDAKTEFVDGGMRQKDQRPADATFGATYTSSINANWGNGTLTGTATGGAAVAGGKLVLTGGTQKFVDYNADLNADSQQVGAIRFRYTPNYSGIPASDMNMFCISATTENDINSIALRHNAITGNIFLRTCNQTGNYINANVQVGQWLPTSGTEYEFELDYDFTAGATRVFINGVQLGATETATGIRSSSIGKLRLGCFNIPGSFVANFSLNDFMVFSTVQHTANYTAGYVVSETIYVADVITLPEMAYTGPGALQQVTGFTTTESNEPRYTLQVARSGEWLYWDGVAYAVSNNTFSQADTKTIANLHLPDLVMAGAIYGQIRIYTTGSNNQQSIDVLSVNVIGQRYSADATIDTVAPIRNDGLDGITAVVSGTGTAKYILKKSGAFYYYSGTAWVASAGTAAQSNTLAEIVANKATFTTTANDLLVRVVLISDTLQDSAIDTLTVLTNFSPVEPVVNTVIVWIYIDDATAVDADTSVTVRLNKTAVRYGAGVIIDGREKTIVPVSGYVEITIPETTSMEAGSYYIFQINDVEYKKTCPSSTISSSILSLPDYGGI